ncbi:HAD family hydrolase [Marisediminicola sp. LYQ85]|uniref:HAD family hydrolase n=1 Tax=Marisediminicola sp. LYQ85 TaxID=3391062 RepID=UPI0039835E4F
MSPSAVLFDIDGTLVDSNFLHIEAWARAFTDVGLTVPAWRIQRAIGADSSELLSQLAGDASDETHDRIKELHTKYYKELAPRLSMLAGAKDLVAAVAGRGVRVVLATSAPPAELDEINKVLDLDDNTYAITSGDDVETAKPEPDIIEIALERAGVTADDAIMVGDAVWDVRAATNAGVRTIGLLSGGSGEKELSSAGAIAVYDDAADLLANIESSPIASLDPS